MKFKLIPLFLTLFTGVCSVFAQPNASGDLKQIMGKTPANEQLATLLVALDSLQTNELFALATNEYEIRSYEQGYALVFNQDFVLKQIQMYDSGYLYSRYHGLFPEHLDSGFALELDDFEAYQYYDYFEADTFNPMVYHSRSTDYRSKVYFRSGHPELIIYYLGDSLLNIRKEEGRANWGMRLIPDGKCVEGNCFSGKGRMEWTSSLVYDGEWDSGIPHGKGSFKDSTGLSYDGEFKLGFLWGEGKLNIPGQYTYNGHLIYGKPCGYGEAVYPNSTRYEGNWVNGLMNGQGHFWYSQKFHYEGEFADNQFNGKGTLHSPDGYVKGSFKNGKPHGYCQQVVRRNHITLSGYWVNGKKEGEFDLFNPISGSTTIQFKNDQEVQ